jgi:hypothetical protein
LHLLVILLAVGGAAIASLFLTWSGTNRELQLEELPRSSELGKMAMTGVKFEGGESGSNEGRMYAGQRKSQSIAAVDSQKPFSNGLPRSSDQVSNADPGEDGEGSTNQESRVIANMPIPAAYGNPKVLEAFSPADQEEIQEIGSNFTATIESSGVTPDSPEYTQVWKKALRDADDSFRAKFGVDAFEAMQMSQGDQ